MLIFKRLAQISAPPLILGGASWTYNTRNTHFIPLTPTSPTYPSTAVKKYNPSSNPPVCVDHAIREVPLSRLRTTDVEELTREFCRGIWGGVGFEVQRRYLERKWRGLEGREGMLWEREELKKGDYEVGTRIADHFEVVERGVDRVVIRCGDSPLITGPRNSDGVFAMEVTTEGDVAKFHLKSVFFDSTPDGAKGGSLPAHIEFLHREYTKLWMETSVRKLVKERWMD
ncbi:hypothetical protein K402DRAFT_385191 [Aulographum hederae CBS 113979]|uniref:Uncharacterized protein n=1 Tax=Aulographum hederae CBS 113979 TaxID=1176131 RepID=A0A6G1GME6_9PEZI|nr:hypothetical protein K402DRAFT_385191 [Aulographum hederae CBS 113979]